MSFESSISELKKSLRYELKEKLSAVSEKQLAEKSKIIVEKLAVEIAGSRGKIIGIYKAVAAEPDVSSILNSKDFRFAMPVLMEKNSPMLFREYIPGDRLESDPIYNKVSQPTADKPDLIPDIVIIPLLGFDERGFRLGRGGGYYDRTLKSLRRVKKIIAIGVGFEIQKTAKIPYTTQDQRMDVIISENDLYKVNEPEKS